MKEASIFQSPHVYDPMQMLSAEERKRRFQTRIDMSFQPYTVFDILQKVFHRDYEADLLEIVGKRPEDFKSSSPDWSVSRAWVNSLKIIRAESVFFQRVEDFQVDLLMDTRIKLEEVRGGNNLLKNSFRIRFSKQSMTRSSLNLRLCRLCLTPRKIINSSPYRNQ